MKPATIALLDAAFALTPREHWTQHQTALDADTLILLPYHPDAVKWCVQGALDAATVRNFAVYEKAIEALYEAIDGDIESWNDHPKRTHKQVLDALYRAATISEEM